MGDFKVATDFMNRRRRNMPPIYNIRRIKEMPLPSLGTHGKHLDQLYASKYFYDSSSESEPNHTDEIEHGLNNTGTKRASSEKT